MDSRAFIGSFVLLSTFAAGASLAACSSSGGNSGPNSFATDASLGGSGNGNSGGNGTTSGGTTGDDGGGSCAPNGDAVRTTPFTFIGPDAGGCTSAQIDALETACYPGSDQACSAFLNDPANAACGNCVYGTGAADVLPPIYNWTSSDGGTGALTYVNVGGCIAAYAPSESACAEAESLATACESDQCIACPLQASAPQATYNQEYAALSQCFDQAASGACATMESTVQMCSTRLDVGTSDGGVPTSGVGSCFHLVDDNGYFTDAVWSYLKLACGGVADAGTSSDAEAGDQ